MAFKYAYEIKTDGTIIRKKCEIFTRSDGSTFLDKPNTLALTPQRRDSEGNWIDNDLTAETSGTRTIANTIWTDAVKETYRSNN